MAVLVFAMIVLKNIKGSNALKKEQEEYILKKREIENKLNLIDNEIEAKDKAIKEARQTLEFNTKMKKEQVKIKYPNAKDIDVVSHKDILNQQDYINNIKLDLKRQELEIEQLTKNIENLNEIDEKLNINYENYKELMEYNEVIEIAKEALETAYTEMRESITPKFTKNLSNLIDNITFGKYKTVKTGNDGVLSLEMENRELR